MWGRAGGTKIGKESRLSPVIRGGGIPILRGGEGRGGGRVGGWVRRGEGRPGLIDKKGEREGEGRMGDYVWHRERADNYLY